MAATYFTHGLHELQNCTSMWADTCFSAKVASSEAASEATRALLEIIGHAVVLLNNNEQALFFLK